MREIGGRQRSAAIRHVSSSFSAISRAVANSSATADHEPFPDANEIASSDRGSSTGRRLDEVGGRGDPAHGLALSGRVAGEERQRRELVRVGLRRRIGVLGSGGERQHRLGG